MPVMVLYQVDYVYKVVLRGYFNLRIPVMVTVLMDIMKIIQSVYYVLNNVWFAVQVILAQNVRLIIICNKINV